jgi:hypothetical protein
MIISRNKKMRKITFYRQLRRDGGIRTGIETDTGGVDQFQEGAEEYDPSLEWFVDLRVEGARLPEDLEEARNWLVENERFINQGFSGLASHLRAGVDSDIWPLRWKISPSPRSARMEIVCSCVRRITATKLSKVMEDMASNWKNYLHLALAEKSSLR